VGPLLRLRSDEQLVRLFRGGSEEAFRVIHDRYRARLHAYARQMLSGSSPDAEDALQDVWVRAYGALRADDREVSLRAWLYRVAHNRCVDELRRPPPPPPETLELLRPPGSDPSATTEQREALQRLVQDIQRLPAQQRSALLMREIVGMSYQDLAGALDVTVPAVKSLLVRARIGLAQASEARDTACAEIRAELAGARERGVRANGVARRHLHDCADCRDYRHELRATQARFRALAPALGPGALVAKLLGIGGSGAAAGGSAGAGATGGAAAAGAVAIGGGSLGVSASHVAAVVAVAVVGAGSAVEVQQTLVPPAHPAPHPAAVVRVHAPWPRAAPLPLRIAAHVPRPAAAPPALPAPAPLQLVRPPVTPPVATPAAPTTAPAAPSNGGAAAPSDVAAPPPDATAPSDNTTPATSADTAPAAGTTTATTPPSSGSGTQPTASPTSAPDATAASGAPPPTTVSQPAGPATAGPPAR
jgi:RNA polymerase sigma factor (sigma-70 family)